MLRNKVKTLGRQFSFGACLLAIPLLATAGGVDGGTETTQDLVAIPRLEVTDLTQLKGYDIFAERMRALQQILPDLEVKLEQAMNGKTWYHVPAEFGTLSNEQEKFHFTIRTPAYQNDRQIFLSDRALEAMSPSDAAAMMMQEAFEALQENRDSQAAAVVVGKVLREHPSSKEIQSLAFANGFGIYLNPRQKNVVRYALRADYLDTAESGFDVVGDVCLDDRAESPMSKKTFDQFTHEVFFSWTDSRVGEVKTVDDAIWSPLGGSYPEWLGKSILRGTNSDLVSLGLFRAVKLYPDEFESSFGNRLGSMSTDEWQRLSKDNKALRESMSGLGDELNKPVESEVATLRRKLTRDPAVIDLLAIIYKANGTTNQLENAYIKQNPQMAAWQDVYDRVKARLNSVSIAQRSRTYGRACDDAAAIKEALKQMQADEKAEAERALGARVTAPGDIAPSSLFHLDEGAPKSLNAE